MNKTRSIILDTDIFGDADDFFALVYALSLPNVKIELIVTADEHKSKRAKQLQYLLSEIGLKIPVVAGKDLGNTRLLFVDDHEDQVLETDYVEAIKRIVETKEKVSYFCLAPQSNLYDFARKYPELVKKLEVVVMGGSLYKDLGRVEHNVRYDIDAAKYTLSKLSVRWVLADQTNADELLFVENDQFWKGIEVCDNLVSKMLLQNAKSFFTNLYPASKFHDPLTISLLTSEFVKFEQRKIKINDDGQIVESELGINTLVSISANYEAFLSSFRQNVLQTIKKIGS